MGLSRLLIFLVCWLATPCQAAERNILLIGTQPDHPWASHMYMFECEMLAKCLRQTPGVEAVTSLNWPTDIKVLDDVDSIVFYSRPAGEIVLHPHNRPIFQKLMDKGVGFVAIHWGTGIGYSKLADDAAVRDAYKKILGGWFRRPPCGIKTTRARLIQADPSHAVCRGWDEYDLRDEFYLDLVFHERMHPILKVNVDGKDQIVAWSFERADSNNGRSFGTTLGHFHDNFARVAFRRAIVNGILWTAHLQPPETGATVTMSADDLKLPPKEE